MSDLRQSIQVEGFAHGAQPIPAASLLRGLLVSGAIFGLDPRTGKLAPDLASQCEWMLQHAGHILAAGDCQWSGVLKMTFYIAPEQSRELLNSHWVRLFPDPASRPARHVIVSDRLHPGMLIQCDLMALAEKSD